MIKIERFFVGTSIRTPQNRSCSFAYKKLAPSPLIQAQALRTFAPRCASRFLKLRVVQSRSVPRLDDQLYTTRLINYPTAFYSQRGQTKRNSGSTCFINLNVLLLTSFFPLVCLVDRNCFFMDEPPYGTWLQKTINRERCMEARHMG